MFVVARVLLPLIAATLLLVGVSRGDYCDDTGMYCSAADSRSECKKMYQCDWGIFCAGGYCGDKAFCHTPELYSRWCSDIKSESSCRKYVDCEWRTTSSSSSTGGSPSSSTTSAPVSYGNSSSSNGTSFGFSGVTRVPVRGMLLAASAAAIGALLWM